MTHTLNLDLAPYHIDMCTDGIRIVDVGQSVLAKLDNRPFVTGVRHSDERCYTKIGKSWCTVTYEENDDDLECLRIEPVKNHKVPLFTELVDWLSLNYDRIQSIGWEMLEEY